MAQSVKLLAEAARSLAFGSIGAAYAAVGTAFANPARILLVQNLTDATVWISFDGVNDHFPLVSNGYILLDVTANRNLVQGMYFEEGTRIYTKRLGVPTSGSVYVTVFYGYAG